MSIHMNKIIFYQQIQNFHSVCMNFIYATKKERERDREKES